MPKQCNKEGCNNPVFSHGYCKLHQHKRTDKKAIESREKLKNKKKGYNTQKPKKRPRINPVSKKRQRQNNLYVIGRNEFIKEKKKAGEYFCMFCGKGFGNEEPEVHHIIGRDDDLLLNRDYWVLAHHKCHVEDYHGLTPACKIDWWKDYLERIKQISPKVYLVDKEKYERSKAMQNQMDELNKYNDHENN